METINSGLLDACEMSVVLSDCTLTADEAYKRAYDFNVNNGKVVVEDLLYIIGKLANRGETQLDLSLRLELELSNQEILNDQCLLDSLTRGTLGGTKFTTNFTYDVETAVKGEEEMDLVSVLKIKFYSSLDRFEITMLEAAGFKVKEVEHMDRGKFVTNTIICW